LYIPEKEVKSEQIYGVFQKIAFLRLENSRKEELSQQIVADSKGGRLFWTEILLSTIIVTFGLLQNSVAVIIGAMLVSPLLRPIKGVAFGIASGHAGNFWKAMKLLILSAVASIALAYIFSLSVPLRVETSEILARTAPNLLDFFIAVASGIIALLALNFSRLSESVAGVAMASALLPPLAVVGIELSLSNWSLAIGSFFLFITNILAILAVGIFIFIFYGFAPHQQETQKRFFREVLILFVLVLGISIPLFSSLTKIAEKITLQTKAQIFLEEALNSSSSHAKLSKLEILKNDDNKVHLLGVLSMPEGAEFFKETQIAIRDQLGDKLGKDVNLELEVLRTASIQSKEEKNKKEAEPVDQKIKKTFSDFLTKKLPQATVINLSVQKIVVPKTDGLTKTLEDPIIRKKENEEKLAIKTVFSLPIGADFTEDNQQLLEAEFEQLFKKEPLSFFWVQVAQQAPPTVKAELSPEEKFHEELMLKWEDFFKTNLPKKSSVENLDVSWVFYTDVNKDDKFSKSNIKNFIVKLDLYMSKEGVEWLPDLRSAIQEFSTDLFDKPAEVKIRSFIFELEEISSLDGQATLNDFKTKNPESD